MFNETTLRQSLGNVNDGAVSGAVLEKYPDVAINAKCRNYAAKEYEKCEDLIMIVLKGHQFLLLLTVLDTM